MSEGMKILHHEVSENTNDFSVKLCVLCGWVFWDWKENKTAPAPPAVRAPVFPHASPVTEGLEAGDPAGWHPVRASLAGSR